MAVFSSIIMFWWILLLPSLQTDMYLLACIFKLSETLLGCYNVTPILPNMLQFKAMSPLLFLWFTEETRGSNTGRSTILYTWYHGWIYAISWYVYVLETINGYLCFRCFTNQIGKTSPPWGRESSTKSCNMLCLVNNGYSICYV